MSDFENVTEVCSRTDTIQKLYKFMESIHDAIGCNDPDCYVLIFPKPLKVIFKPDKDYDFKTAVFISQCAK